MKEKNWGVGGIQFLQVTVCNVMTAPVRDSIELDTVRELHVVCFVKLPELLGTLCLSLQIPSCSLLLCLYAGVVREFVFFKVFQSMSAGRNAFPSSR